MGAIKNTEQKSVEKDIKAPVFASTVATPATSTKQEKQEDSKGKKEKSGMAKELSSKIVPDVKVESRVPKASSVFVGSLDFEKEEKSKTNYVKDPEYSFGGSYKSTEKKSASTKPIPDPAKAVSASEKVMTQEKTTTTRKGKSSSEKKKTPSKSMSKSKSESEGSPAPFAGSYDFDKKDENVSGKKISTKNRDGSEDDNSSAT